MGSVAILGIIGIIGQFVDNPLIKRLLVNACEWIHTPVIFGTEIDEWVLRFLYNEHRAPENRDPEAPRSLEEIQAKVDGLTPEEKTKAQVFRKIDPLPWIEAVPLEQ